jgi:hypothetical protein
MWQGVNVFQVMGATRPLIVLHPKYIDEIKSHPHLDFEGATQKVVRILRILGTGLTPIRTSSMIAFPASNRFTRRVLAK